MGKPHSPDLRDRVVGALEGELSTHEVVARFSIGIATAGSWGRLKRSKGDVRPARQNKPKGAALDAHAPRSTKQLRLRQRSQTHQHGDLASVAGERRGMARHRAWQADTERLHRGFNGKLRDELFDQTLFTSLTHARFLMHASLSRIGAMLNHGLHAPGCCNTGPDRSK